MAVAAARSRPLRFSKADRPLRFEGLDWWRITSTAADAREPAVRRAFLRSLRNLRAGIDLRAVEAALAAGNVEAVLRAIPWDRFEAGLEGVRRELEEVVHSSASGTARRTLRVKGIGATLRWDKTNPRAAAWAATRGAELVREVQAETAASIRLIVGNGFVLGHTRRTMSRQIRDLVGLTAKQTQAVLNFEEGLRIANRVARMTPDQLDEFLRGPLFASERLIASRIRAGESVPSVMARRWKLSRNLGVGRAPLSEARVRELGSKYRDRYVRFRAETIARTETINASNRGQELLWNEAVAEGLIDPAVYEREWVAVVPDIEGRTCPICVAADGTRAPLDGGTYPNGYSGPTAHPRCRCSQRVVPKGETSTAPEAPAADVFTPSVSRADPVAELLAPGGVRNVGVPSLPSDPREFAAAIGRAMGATNGGYKVYSRGPGWAYCDWPDATGAREIGIKSTSLPLLNRAIAKIRNEGVDGLDSHEQWAIKAIIHEHNHRLSPAGTPDDYGNIAQYWVEEGLVELRARDRTLRVLGFSEDQPWETLVGTVAQPTATNVDRAYNSPSFSFAWYRDRFGGEAIEELFGVGQDVRFSRWSFAVLDWMHRTIPDEVPAGWIPAGFSSSDIFERTAYIAAKARKAGWTEEATARAMNKSLRGSEPVDITIRRLTEP